MRTATSPDQRSCVPPGPGGRRLARSLTWPLARRPRRSSRPEHPANLPGAVIELVVEVDRSADQGQMAERLREIAELTAGAVDLLGVQAEVVGVGEHLLEDQPRLVQPTGTAQRIDVPERAQRERALVAGQPVR